MARASLSLFLLSSLILCACLQPVHAGRYLQQLNLGGLVGGLLGTVANLGQTVTQLLGGPSTSNDAGGELQNLNLISEVTRRFIQQNPQYNGTEIPPSVFQSLMQSVGLLSLPGLSVGLTSPDVKEIVRTLRAPTILSQMAGNDLALYCSKSAGDAPTC